ncbi:MAG: CheR family methyltransferase [Chloroflexota bacterium]
MSSVEIASAITRASQVIEARVGIKTQAQPQTMLEDVLLTLSHGDIESFVDKLERTDETAEVWQQLIDELTIGETYFLRDRSHFNMLQDFIIPQIVHRKRETGELAIDIWSAGCATGEETYSLAILLTESIPDISRWTIRLIGTDVNARALLTARRGIYRQWAFRHTATKFQEQYFQRAERGLQIRPEIQQFVHFQQHNLLLEPPVQQVDLVLCRNVLLYFSDSQAQRAENNMTAVIDTDGWLLLGKSEHMRSQTRLNYNWRPFRTTEGEVSIFQKLGSVQSTAPKHQAVAEVIETDTQPADELPSIQKLYLDAVQALHAGNSLIAREAIEHILHLHPSHAPGRLLNAYLFANQQQVDEAHRQIDLALEYAPLLADGYYLRAMLFLENNALARARTALRAAVYCQRNHPLALFLLGNLLMQEGKVGQAMRYWRNAIRAISSLSDESQVSDLSDITTGQLRGLLQKHLDSWEE